jgi:hypothetical protein
MPLSMKSSPTWTRVWRRRACERTAEKFASPDHMGPNLLPTSKTSRTRTGAIRMRDAYERVNHLLSELGIL